MTDRHQQPPTPVRMPDDLKAQIQAQAEANGRSLHAELLARLEASLAAAAATEEEVAHLRARLKNADALIRNVSEGYVALYDEMPGTQDEGLRKLYVTCRARLSNDPEEIKGLASGLGESDEELQTYLDRMADTARRKNARAADRFRVLQSTRGAQAKRLAMAKQAEEMSVKIATNLITGEAFLPGNFEDYPLDAWVHGTGHEATVVQDIGLRLGPEAERVRAALRSFKP